MSTPPRDPAETVSITLDAAQATSVDATASKRRAKAQKQREWVDYSGEMTITKYRALRVVYRAIGVGAIGMGVLVTCCRGCQARSSSSSPPAS